MKKHIGELIDQIARTENLSQTKLAEAAGISYPQLNKFLNGKSNLSLEHFLSLLKVLNIDIYELLRGKVKKQFVQFDETIETPKDCLNFLYDNMDIVRQQATLKTLQSAMILTNKKIPNEIEQIINRSTNLL